MLNKTNVHERLNKVRDRSSSDIMSDVKELINQNDDARLSSDEVKNKSGEGNDLIGISKYLSYRPN